MSHILLIPRSNHTLSNIPLLQSCMAVTCKFWNTILAKCGAQNNVTYLLLFLNQIVLFLYSSTSQVCGSKLFFAEDQKFVLKAHSSELTYLMHLNICVFVHVCIWIYMYVCICLFAYLCVMFLTLIKRKLVPTLFYICPLV